MSDTKQYRVKVYISDSGSLFIIDQDGRVSANYFYSNPDTWTECMVRAESIEKSDLVDYLGEL